MNNFLPLLENVGVVASLVLGAGTTICGSVLVTKMVLSLASSPAPKATTKTIAIPRAPSKKTASPCDVYNVIYRAVLESQASESETAAPASTATDDDVPVIAKPTKKPEPIEAGPAPATAA